MHSQLTVLPNKVFEIGKHELISTLQNRICCIEIGINKEFNFVRIHSCYALKIIESRVLFGAYFFK